MVQGLEERKKSEIFLVSAHVVFFIGMFLFSSKLDWSEVTWEHLRWRKRKKRDRKREMIKLMLYQWLESYSLNDLNMSRWTDYTWDGREKLCRMMDTITEKLKASNTSIKSEKENDREREREREVINGWVYAKASRKSMSWGVFRFMNLKVGYIITYI